MTDGHLYHDRESIQPRAFAVRHLVIQEVKFRKLRVADEAQRAMLDRVARGADVEYDAATHSFVIRCDGIQIRRAPLDGFALYERGDNKAPHAVPEANVRHWDSALESNRRLVSEIVDAMIASLTGARTE